MYLEDKIRMDIALDLLVDNILANDYCVIEGEDINKLGCHTNKCRSCIKKYINGRVKNILEKQEMRKR